MDYSSQQNVPVGNSSHGVLPWERFAWLPYQRERIYRDWGLYLSHKEMRKVAEKCYNKCLEINPNDATALYMRSNCKRAIANTKSALEDARAAEEIEDFNPAISSAICHALHDLNEFEKCKAHLHEYVLKYTSAAVKSFFNHIVVVDENLNDCIGDSLGYFMLRNRKHIDKVIKSIKPEDIKKPQPRWKVLKSQNLCDVLSIPEMEELLLSPRELARRKRWLRIYNQTYFGRNWIDIDFMRNFVKSDSWFLQNFVGSKPVLRRLAEENFEIAKKFVKMLHTRSPVYNEFDKKFKNKSLYKKNKKDFIHIVQYRTRRHMYSILSLIKEYRKKGKIEQMTQYIEAVMGDYVVLITNRILPWKFEFMNEVYNTLALAHADKFIVNEKLLSKGALKKDLIKFLNIPYDTTDRPTIFAFGKKETYLPITLQDNKEIRYQKLISRLETRKIFAKYSIERCYLWHEIARTFLKMSLYDPCCSAARKAIDESRNCKSTLWEFLSIMLIVKAYASLRKVESCQSVLEQAQKVAKDLGSEKLLNYVEIAALFGEQEISLKRKTQSIESVRRRKSDTISLLSTTFDIESASLNNSDM